MYYSAFSDTVFGKTLRRALDSLKVRGSDVLAKRRLQNLADKIAVTNAVGAWELRAYACTISDSFDAADET
ncbi:hypothetical protein [Stenotrophomonas sp. 22385]|uniref:hypothetical protein n=1 Tax=Stenotrophomonas sp. 22385 TaxID=3453915 RepID=UPI003F86866A